MKIFFAFYDNPLISIKLFLKIATTLYQKKRILFQSLTQISKLKTTLNKNAIASSDFAGLDIESSSTLEAAFRYLNDFIVINNSNLFISLDKSFLFICIQENIFIILIVIKQRIIAPTHKIRSFVFSASKD